MDAENITNRLELSFLNVLAFPNASRTELVCRTSRSIPLLPPLTVAKYCIAIFAVSVFPAPLSPLQDADIPKLQNQAQTVPRDQMKQQGKVICNDRNEKYPAGIKREMLNKPDDNRLVCLFCKKSEFKQKMDGYILK